MACSEQYIGFLASLREPSENVAVARLRRIHGRRVCEGPWVRSSWSPPGASPTRLPCIRRNRAAATFSDGSPGDAKKPMYCSLQAMSRKRLGQWRVLACDPRWTVLQMAGLFETDCQAWVAIEVP